MLAIFIAIAVWATSINNRKEQEARGLGNLLANTGPAVGFAIAILFSEDIFILTIGFCACLGAALADTVSSELGTIYGKRPVDIITFEPTEIGENGAITVLGTLFGLTAAMTMGVFAQEMELTSYTGGVAIAIGAFAGCMVDSVLGSVYENANEMTNDGVNAWSNLAGGMTAVYIALFL